MELDLNGFNADSLVQMLKASFTLENWDSMLIIADRLYTEVNTFYKMNQQERIGEKRVSCFGLTRNIVYYFGYSMCLKGIAFEKLGRYNEARECIAIYKDLGWIRGIDADGQEEVNYYREIAKGNQYIIELNEGNVSVLPDYLAFLRNTREEMMPGVLYILDSAIKYRFSVDHVLEEFSEQITAMAEYYEIQRNIRYYIDYSYLKARYFSINDKVDDALIIIVQSLATSVKLKDDRGFKKLAALFETLRGQATSEQLDKYLGIMKSILD
ncbi:hypothetical protein [Paenibacillus camerounensis]|uniref:hypothetical protein n=1 Tax=Paenibacillus camerounensis TaxID=1243663 RepID=UPI00069464B1|nr:hypothetical protein [Paenibacillus camerounensis]